MNPTMTILIDTREQKPAIFPARIVVQDPGAEPGDPTPTTLRIQTRSVRLPTADYAAVLGESPVYSPDEDRGTCLIETKRGLLEIAANCFGPNRARMERVLDDMASKWRHPILLMEGEIHQDSLVAPRQRELLKFPPECAIDGLLRMTFARQISVHIMPASRNTRAYVGTYIARLLFNAACAGDLRCRPPKSSRPMPQPPPAPASP